MHALHDPCAEGESHALYVFLDALCTDPGAQKIAYNRDDHKHIFV